MRGTPREEERILGAVALACYACALATCAAAAYALAWLSLAATAGIAPGLQTHSPLF